MGPGAHSRAAMTTHLERGVCVYVMLLADALEVLRLCTVDGSNSDHGTPVCRENQTRVRPNLQWIGLQFSFGSPLTRCRFSEVCPPQSPFAPPCSKSCFDLSRNFLTSNHPILLHLFVMLNLVFVAFEQKTCRAELSHPTRC